MMTPLGIQFCVYPAVPAVAMPTCPSHGLEVQQIALPQIMTQQQLPVVVAVRAPTPEAQEPGPVMARVPEATIPDRPQAVKHEDPMDDQQKTNLRALPGLRVLILVGVSPTASVLRLERAVEKALEAKVIRSQPLWNRGGLVVEMDREVFLRSRRLAVGLPGVHLLRSCKETIAAPSPSPILNVRFFVLDPNIDFAGSAMDKVVHKRAKEEWKLQTEEDGEFGDYLLLGQHLEAEAGESWIKMAKPIRPKRMTEVSGRQIRLYTQLYFGFADASITLRVSETTDGKVIQAFGLHLVIRSEYAKPWAMDKAPQIANPRLTGNRGHP
eukprot:Hpha_TRINITY_DN16779_c5_g2::TRINITY_DN16779_c5_g2_i1::g.79340::m.79340